MERRRPMAMAAGLATCVGTLRTGVRLCLVGSLLVWGCGRASTAADPAPRKALFSEVVVPTRSGGGVVAEAPSTPLLNDAAIDFARNAVMQRLGRIAETLSESEYSHHTSVHEGKGVYRFDCSGMTQWVLRRTTPRAASAVAYKLEQRPLARDFYRRIAAVQPGSDRHGWRRVARVDELEPGDVFAWIKPSEIDSPHTGHVGFVVLPPVRVPGYDNAYLVRIADSTSLLHDDDTREGRDGFGFGTILLVSNPGTGAPVAYGWAGLRWRAFETDIALGRPLE